MSDMAGAGTIPDGWYDAATSMMLMMDDEPIIAIRVKDGIFVGNAAAASDLNLLYMNKITHVINCAGDEVPNFFSEEEGLEYLSFPWKECSAGAVCPSILFDHGNETVTRTVSFIDQALERGECVLVHSRQGISRAPALLAGYLIVKYGWRPNSALKFIQQAHSAMAIQPPFLSQVHSLAHRFPVSIDIFDEDVDESSFGLDNDQWMMRNTLLNGLSNVEQDMNSLYRHCVAQLDTGIDEDEQEQSEEDALDAETGAGATSPSMARRPAVAKKTGSLAASRLTPLSRGSTSSKSSPKGPSSPRGPRITFVDTKKGTRVDAPNSTPLVAGTGMSDPGMGGGGTALGLLPEGFVGAKGIGTLRRWEEAHPEERVVPQEDEMAPTDLPLSSNEEDWLEEYFKTHPQYCLYLSDGGPVSDGSAGGEGDEAGGACRRSLSSLSVSSSWSTLSTGSIPGHRSILRRRCRSPCLRPLVSDPGEAPKGKQSLQRRSTGRASPPLASTHVPMPTTHVDPAAAALPSTGSSSTTGGGMMDGAGQTFLRSAEPPVLSVSANTLYTSTGAGPGSPLPSPLSIPPSPPVVRNRTTENSPAQPAPEPHPTAPHPTPRVPPLTGLMAGGNNITPSASMGSAISSRNNSPSRTLHGGGITMAAGHQHQGSRRSASRDTSVAGDSVTDAQQHQPIFNAVPPLPMELVEPFRCTTTSEELIPSRHRSGHRDNSRGSGEGSGAAGSNKEVSTVKSNPPPPATTTSAASSRSAAPSSQKSKSQAATTDSSPPPPPRLFGKSSASRPASSSSSGTTSTTAGKPKTSRPTPYTALSSTASLRKGSPRPNTPIPTPTTSTARARVKVQSSAVRSASGASSPSLLLSSPRVGGFASSSSPKLKPEGSGGPPSTRSSPSASTHTTPTRQRRNTPALPGTRPRSSSLSSNTSVCSSSQQPQPTAEGRGSGDGADLVKPPRVYAGVANRSTRSSGTSFIPPPRLSSVPSSSSSAGPSRSSSTTSMRSVGSTGSRGGAKGASSSSALSTPPSQLRRLMRHSNSTAVTATASTPRSSSISSKKKQSGKQAVVSRSEATGATHRKPVVSPPAGAQVPQQHTVTLTRSSKENTSVSTLGSTSTTTKKKGTVASRSASSKGKEK